MPKALSLKKSQQTAPPKNQKPITQFFKQTNATAVQDPKKSPAKSQSSQVNGVDKTCNKRKASSPAILDSIELVDDDSTDNVASTNSRQDNEFHTSKKVKCNANSTQKSPIKDGTPKKSLLKENHGGIKISSRKNSDLNGLNANSEDSLNSKVGAKDRLPLTPIKITTNEHEENSSQISCNSASSHKTSCIDQGNHVRRNVTPKKVLQFDDCDKGIKNERTPKKSPAKAKELQTVRVVSLKTPEKGGQDELSPSKVGSTVKTLEFSPGTVDGFDDQWDFDDVTEDCPEDLDLTTMQRCEVLSVTQHQGRLELRLKNASNNKGTCYVEGVWLETPICPGEIISVVASRNSSGQFYVGNNAGLISLRPDFLMSATSVVAGVFCKRKAVLQSQFPGIDAGNTAMTIGILIHELVQLALAQHILDVRELHVETDEIIKDNLQTLSNAGLSDEVARTTMKEYLQPLEDFMLTYVALPPLREQPQKGQWDGTIDQIIDIEENVCCPQLGLKGKIDATVQVTIHNREGGERATVPLEIKSGRASMSAEHRGQLVLYNMMMSMQRGLDPSTAAQSGLLLYLKDRVDLRQISCGYPERRDLLMLRNQLARHLAVGPQDIDPEQVTDIEDAMGSLQQTLPEPVHHHNACSKCPYLTLCSLHLWHTEGPSVSDSHPLVKLRQQALGHLTPQHIEYFLRWAALLRMEERGQTISAPLHALWTETVEKRSKRGNCVGNLKLKLVEISETDDKNLHIFERQVKEIETLNSNSKAISGPQEGEFSIVSIDGRPWIAGGPVIEVNETEISIKLFGNLTSRYSKDQLFHIDRYESYATTATNLANLGVLLEDSERSAILRKLIIDKVPPVFESKMTHQVAALASEHMRDLNRDQQRAILKALSAKDYALLQGLPGTGKTQTIVVLIQMLVALKQRVLVTAHTHSAVDTVLTRLPSGLKIIRLGSLSRMSPLLLYCCEQYIVAKCDNTKQLEKMYDSMEVVGVTCLGAAHGMVTRRRFDVCIVDEATQVLQTTVLRPLFAADKFILVGDPQQLPPVVRSRAARRLGMEDSLFHRLMSDKATSTLHLQYRMNQALTDVANKVAYNGQLKCASSSVAKARVDVDLKKLANEALWRQSACSPEPEYAAMFLDMAAMDAATDAGKTCTNTEEVCVVLALVDALVQGGVIPPDIGIIAPYRDQVSLLRRAMADRDVECSTVDQFQGRDKSVIVFSCTRKDGQDDRKVKEGEILNDQRRLAVSVTRAKHKLLIVGNSLALLRYMPVQRLIEACKPLPLDKQDIDCVVNKYKMEFV